MAYDKQELIDLFSYDTVIDNNHESLLRSYHILNYVLKMINRGDSKETINEVVCLLRRQDLKISNNIK